MFRGNKTIVLCVPRLNSKYWKSFVLPFASEIRFFTDKIKFDLFAETPFPLPICLIIFDPDNSTKNYELHNYNNGEYHYWKC